MKVIVCPYDPMWKSAFEEIKAEIEAATGDDILGIEHVGSTSVEGMWAKPCIDIDVVIEDYSKFNIVKSYFVIAFIFVALPHNVYARVYNERECGRNGGRSNAFVGNSN
jgi:GrpB-like predicted nucleotidyltransferase (UPF0157 family)